MTNPTTPLSGAGVLSSPGSLDALINASKQITLAINNLNSTLASVFPTGNTATLALAKLTIGGTQGSAVFTKGILTSYTAPS